ncbi:MAG: amino acid adenylation domain-containing protein [Cyanobacteria bacterium P01_D01_bin.56]
MSNQTNRNIQSIYPLTPMQQGMLFHSAYAADSGIYIGQYQLTLDNTVNWDAFKQAWQQLIDTHNVLRTCFVLQRDQPLQVVLKQVTLPWQYYDWQSLSKKEQQNQLQNWLNRDRKTGFDATKAPLIRCTLIALDDQNYQFIWTHHHALLDGWSLPILFQDLLKYYESNLQGQPLSPSKRYPYQNYVTWLQKQDKASAKTYWEQRLSGFHHPTNLPFQTTSSSDHRQTLKRNTKQYRYSISTELTASIQIWLRKQRLSLATLIYGVWGSLLGRYSGESDVVFGIIVSGRSSSLIGIETMVGLFINALPFRVTFAPDQTTISLLKQIQQDFQDLQSHGYLSIVELHRLSELSSRDSLFNTLVVVENYPVDKKLTHDQQILPVKAFVAHEQDNYQLSLSIAPGEQLSLQFSYDSELYTEKAIERIAGHFETLLQGIITGNDSIRVSQLPLLTDSERQQLLVSWNDTTVEYSQTLCLHQLFEAQVRRTPNTVAVVFGSQQLTYRDLNSRSNQLAYYLQQAGVGPETTVGICVERSIEMVVAILGILKTGGTYVPLDPNYPQERLNLMVEDAQLTILLTQTHLAELLPQEAVKIVKLDQDFASVSHGQHGNLSTAVSEDSLAYVIYTSGSTGTPKGVCVSHRSVVRLVKNPNYVDISNQDTFLQLASVSFDAATFEIWGALINGASLVIYPKPLLSLDTLASVLETHQVSILWLTAGLFHMIVDEQLSMLSPVKQLLAGGDILSPQHIQKVLKTFPKCRLINGYGPTENTTFTCCYTVPTVTAEQRNIPIGKPINETQTYVLDKYLQLVPVGVPGELYIGGAGLAKGYLNQPKLTADKFIENPYGSGRLYKTGDRVRYLTDGNIEFLGRIDFQVKIRGFRLELGEIEAILSQVETVNQAVVIARDNIASDKCLVAYVSGDKNLDAQTLQEHLQTKLPDYMVPSAFVVLDELPLTPNGKVDRKALPDPTLGQTRTTPWIAPQTERQVLIAKLIAKVLSLSVEQVGLHDNFFELGGHSLLATQLATRFRQVLELDLPLHQLFNSPTVTALDAWAEQQSLSSDLGEIIPTSRQDLIALSFAQERLWFMDQLNPGNAAYNVSTAVRLTGKLQIEALQKSLEAVVDRHEILRTVFGLEQGLPVQKIVPSLEIDLPIIDLQNLPLDQQNKEVQRLATANEQHPFDLAEGPLFRVCILRLSPQEHMLFWAAHHIISDLWSVGILVRDFTAFYTAQVKSIPSPLSPLPIQYADFAHWQRQWLTGDVLEHQLNYWRQKLGGNLPVLRLPADYPVSSGPSFGGATEKLQLSSELTNKLQALSQGANATLFMTLLAGFKALLYAYTGQHDMVVGTDIANRNRAEIEDLIGFFVNLLVLRTDLSNNPNFNNYLQQVRKVALDAYAHQDLPFAKLVQALQTNTSAPGQRRGEETPLFQVLFVMQNAPITPVELPGLALTPLDLGSKFAKFALALFVHETPEGIFVEWNYSTDRFAAETISHMANRYKELLQQVAEQPDIPLETLATSLTQRQPTRKSTIRRKKFKRVTPQAVQQLTTDLVTQQSLSCGVSTIQPSHENVDLISWAKEQREMLNQKLYQKGAVLFRGFSIFSAQDFEQAAAAICPDLFGEYGDLPRTGVSDKVYGSTPYPEDKAILFHNESSHLQQWPMKIWFCCLQPSKQGGETPIVDCRQIYKSLSPDVRDRIKEKQLMYVRNYIKGLDVDWQDFFHTTDRSVVEQQCREAGVEWEWLENDGLQTRQVRPATVQHPQTGEWVVFNQLQLHHLSYLDAPTQKSLLSLFGEDRLPRQVYYGDGSPIEPEILDALQAAYKQAEKIFSWQEGDILMLDNMLMAHGRNPYVGPRKIAVAMGEIMTESKLKVLSSS